MFVDGCLTFSLFLPLCFQNLTHLTTKIQGLFSPCEVLNVAADAGSAEPSRAVHSIAFNPSESNASLFAAGDAGGNVLVYELPIDLTLSDAIRDEEAVTRLEQAGRE